MYTNLLPCEEHLSRAKWVVCLSIVTMLVYKLPIVELIKPSLKTSLILCFKLGSPEAFRACSRLVIKGSIKEKP